MNISDFDPGTTIVWQSYGPTEGQLLGLVHEGQDGQQDEAVDPQWVARRRRDHRRQCVRLALSRRHQVPLPHVQVPQMRLGPRCESVRQLEVVDAVPDVHAPGLAEHTDQMARHGGALRRHRQLLNGL